jgi:hypothetical protein
MMQCKHRRSTQHCYVSIDRYRCTIKPVSIALYLPAGLHPPTAVTSFTACSNNTWWDPVMTERQLWRVWILLAYLWHLYRILMRRLRSTKRRCWGFKPSGSRSINKTALPRRWRHYDAPKRREVLGPATQRHIPEDLRHLYNPVITQLSKVICLRISML